MKVYGALENAQIEWFTNAGKPTAATFPYRVIYVTDLSQFQVSDGSNWLAIPSSVASTTFSGTNTFNGATVLGSSLSVAGTTTLSSYTKLGLTTDTTSTGAVASYANLTPAIEFTAALTSLAGFSNTSAGSVIVLVNRTGSIVTVKNDDSGTTAGQRIKTGTGASLSLPTEASGLLCYLGPRSCHIVGGSGGGSSLGGAKNYFNSITANGGFETGAVSPWSAFTTTLSSGLPTTLTYSATQMALAATTTNPLSGTYSGQLVKSAAAAQGQGFISGVITIDREDLGKMLTGSFAYEVTANASNFDASGSSTQSLEIWVYNVTGNYWIQPAGYRGINQNAGPGKVVFTFQSDATPANNTYRFAIITAQTAATGYTINFDDFSVGPQAIPMGMPATDWQTYALTIGASTTAPTPGSGATSSAKWRRMGDSMEIVYWFSQTAAGSAGTGTYLFPLPPGYQIDLNKVSVDTSNNNSSGAHPVGMCVVSNTNAAVTNTADTGVAVVYNSGNIAIFGNGGTAGQMYVTGSNSFAMSNTTLNYSFRVVVPIAGWSSNVQMSNDTDTRVVAFQATLNSNYSAGASAYVKYDTVKFDTHSGYNISTGLYTVPVSGYYHVHGVATCNGATNTFVVINGSAIYNPNVTSNGVQYGYSTLVKVNAGDTIGFYGTTAETYYGSGGPTGINNYININRLTGPSVIAMSEKVVAIYNLTVNASAGPTQPVQWATKLTDTHNAVTTGTSWRFTAPRADFYTFFATAYGNQGIEFNLWKNGVQQFFIGSSSAGGIIATGSGIVYLNAGEYIDFRPSGTVTITAANQCVSIRSGT